MENLTVSVPLDVLTLDELVMLSQGVGRQIDTLRGQRAYLQSKIDERLREIQRCVAPVVEVDAVAPGAVLDVSLMKR